MPPDDFTRFIATIHPYDSFGPDETARVAALFRPVTVAAGNPVFAEGDAVEGLYLIAAGRVTVTDAAGEILSSLGRGNSFGERGLMADGRAATTVRAEEDTDLWILPAQHFHALFDKYPVFRRFFERGARRSPAIRPDDLTSVRVEELMTRNPITCSPDMTIIEAARVMRDRKVSSLLIPDETGGPGGIITIRDLAGRVLAEGVPYEARVGDLMTCDPVTLTPDDIGSDVLNRMMERGIGHVPVVEGTKLVGIVTRTDLTRRQALTSSGLVGDIARAEDAETIAAKTGRIPMLLAQLVGAGNRHDVVTRLITDIADAATRRFIALFERENGAAPARYLWLACGSQGRREQTGVSDQDNCLILEDAATPDDMAYFESMARFVTDGLNQAGYVYCPGDMMASNPRWRQPLSVWRGYFSGWIATPNPEAQMLASVMFDLRPIAGSGNDLFETLQGETLEAASKNSIFVAHMVSNSLKHRPPLGLLRGLATLRSGEHRNTIDMKANGVVPVVDLARLYALMSRLTAVNSRARIKAAGGTGAVSASGARDLLDAYDVIAGMRLEHQARQVAGGQAADNYLAPSELSDFDRSHLRDAFFVVRTMQSAVGQGRGSLL